jgi:single-stranded-DNA-specific exonuclease
MPRITTRSRPADTCTALQQAGIAPTWARLYAARGITHPEQVAHRLPQLLPPTGLLHADRAATLLADAIAENKRLLIVADYDADGATACAVGVRGLRMLGAEVDYLVPNRIEHGYGLTPGIVALAAERRPDLLVTVDNGIAGSTGWRRPTRSASRCWSPTTTCPATPCRTLRASSIPTSPAAVSRRSTWRGWA